MNELPKVKVLVVDDEALARARLRDLVHECAWPPAEVIGEAGSAADALHWLAGGGRADLVLLDIAMPGLDGLQLAERLRALDRPPAVVFTTAHPQHALRAFEVAAIDYLPKPVRRARLHEAIARAAGRPAPLPPAPAPPTQAAADAPSILVNERGHLLRVPHAHVIYLKAELKYVTVRTHDASHVIDGSLTELEPRMGDRFLRVHRNALVALGAMRELRRGRKSDDSEETEDGEGGESWWVRVAPVDEWLAVSRRQLPLVKEALKHGQA